MNGDILPGQVEGSSVANPGRNLPDYLQVRLAAPLKNHAGRNDSLINVRAEDVARVVTGMSENRFGKSGYIRLKLGDAFEATSIRWRSNEIWALTADGVRAIAISDVAELHQPVKERIRLMRSGKTEIGFNSSGHQVLFQTVNGARLTAREGKIVRSSDSRTLIQPSWSLDAIMMAPGDIVEILFLRLNEIPLAALPTETLAENSFLGRWNWTRNRNVRGGRLDSGDRDSSIGVGMHAHTAVAFYLPTGAESFSTWLGLDRSVGDGGCATASVHLNDLKGEPIWRSGFLQGGKPSVRVGPLSVKNQERLVLVTNFGHQGRPQGSDPFDIRDEVDWIQSIVETRLLDTVQPDLEEVFPFLKGWTIGEQDRARLRPIQIWNPHEGRWVYALKWPTPPASADDGQKQPPLLNAPGVHYEYYENYREAALPDFDKMTPTARGIVPSISQQVPGIKPNYVAVRFQSTLVVPRDGFYEFSLTSDDGSKMYINNKLVIANDGLHPAIEKQGRAGLKKGGVPIRVEFFNAAGPMTLNLTWKGPGIPRQVIQPDSYDLSKIPPTTGLNLATDYTAIETVSLNRTMKVTSPNAWLSMYAGKNEDGFGDYEFEIRVDGKPIQNRTGQSIHTRHPHSTHMAGGIWNLGNYVGRETNLQVDIKPFGYPGHDVPSLYVSQLEAGPKSVRAENAFIAKDLLGRWQLRGAQSTIKKSYHNGLLSGGEGSLQLADDGTVSMWLRFASGIEKAGVGYVLHEENELIFNYINGDWINDLVRPSDDRKSLIVQEQEDADSWRLVFTRDELSSFHKYAGVWNLQAAPSKVHNQVHSGAFTGGAGRLSIGPDGGFKLRLQYPPNAQGQVRSEASTGNLVLENGIPIFKYDDDNWSDDHGELATKQEMLTLRERENEGDWTLVFLKQ
jgi:hypothetical protein